MKTIFNKTNNNGINNEGKLTLKKAIGLIQKGEAGHGLIAKLDEAKAATRNAMVEFQAYAEDLGLEVEAAIGFEPVAYSKVENAMAKEKVATDKVFAMAKTVQGTRKVTRARVEAANNIQPGAFIIKEEVEAKPVVLSEEERKAQEEEKAYKALISDVAAIVNDFQIELIEFEMEEDAIKAEQGITEEVIEVEEVTKESRKADKKAWARYLATADLETRLELGLGARPGEEKEAEKLLAKLNLN